ncbi:hypothetical protein GCM10023185_30000 [Hymenobacter saemangeumensis]|uniref:Uncharacterized protein n=1 Tax=Hymenobacter saemangeumensis TaxID=1084522 RepID=A0ABP8ILP5_9BACT
MKVPACSLRCKLSELPAKAASVAEKKPAERAETAYALACLLLLAALPYLH